MVDGEIILHGVTFTIWTGLVALGTWLILKKYYPEGKEGNGATDEYFAGGHSLKWYVVAGSLMLTNLSSEQLIGLNGTVFKDGCIVGIWWEAGAAIAMLLSAGLFVPKYMQLGLITTTGFLGERFNMKLRVIVSLIFTTYFTLILCPLVLYAGALAIITTFNLNQPLWVISTLTGALGAIYAISGGLKAVAVSDCLNGIGLLVIGLWVPIAAASKLPNGLQDVFDRPALLTVFGTTNQIYDEDTATRKEGTISLPWHVLPVGLTLGNIYYWATNQMIVQRVLGAESLADGQKGVLFAAFMKIMGFTFLCLPGVVAIVLEEKGILDEQNIPFKITGKADTVFPRLVRWVMPTWALGIFLGVLLGSVLSTFNSALNSASTMFGLEVWKVMIEEDATDEKIVWVANIFGVVATLFSFIIAPQLAAVESLFSFLQNVNTIVSLPILLVFLVGISTTLPDGQAALAGFSVGAVSLLGLQFISEGSFIRDMSGIEGGWTLHYLHSFTVSFFLSLLVIVVMTYLRKDSLTPYEPKVKGKVALKPWSKALPLSMANLIILFSLLFSMQFANYMFFWATVGCWFIGTGALLALPVDGDGATGDTPGIEMEGAINAS